MYLPTYYLSTYFLLVLSLTKTVSSKGEETRYGFTYHCVPSLVKDLTYSMCSTKPN